MAINSFFSYKGGSGRTTTTLNTLYYLIQETQPDPSHPLVIIDADNESYGMSMLLKDPEESYPTEVSLQGLGLTARQDTFVPSGRPDDWRSYRNLAKFFIPVGHYFTKDIDKEAVLLLRSDVTPAEQQAAFEAVFSVDKNGRVHDNLKALVEKMEICDCTVVFDTPSGTQDMATFALNYSDTIVCCMRPSVQFEMGTRLCFEKLIAKWGKYGNRKKIIFCPSAVPFRKTDVDGNVYPEHYINTVFSRFKSEMDTKAHDTGGTVKIVWGMQDGEVPGIPEVDRFKWQECCLAKMGGNKEDERMAKEKYRKLAQLIDRCNG
ncbi:MAG: hypothetical protein K2M89_06125 [Clostridiales bacterium]|nr:hypothetical protein [Clostridiales bacterium]